MRFPTLGKTGQMAIVWGVIGMLIAVAFGALIFGKVHSVATTQADDDNASNLSLAENIVADTGATAADVFPLILLMVIVGVIVGLILILKGMM